MDDLIVIILTLIIAVVGVLGQIKKKKQIPADTESDETKENIWDIIQNEINKPIQTTGAEMMEDRAVIESEQVEHQAYQFKTKSENISTVQKESEETISIKSDEPVKEKFPLKKAVIYSEILNAKYI